ncbi:Aminopeptidase S (Leu, Val, Phe, Tyr preference) [Olavius algarvensis spirochete endosymbiont]|uniref:aminopeptidase n=1 Tax=Olavius algarvensis spirochete endosymbiont TaxID=260710 RepID=UPI000F16E4C3|nr:aminopeptidase [Olavius algarvensis spirochete endosymbiont]CAD7836814.1 MAG: Aminopeptidase S (Leu, Val, Phe, Tyr preference) (EC 3.4.11.24) [Olavius algarvensis spirochete endosymbiont]VDA99084.1 Aminopeptidase S (Leu, Val, Phe, Tyr preference) [Olavius algarvensis spirochete endosymbiont]
MFSKEIDFRGYAELLIDAGIALGQGEKLFIHHEPGAALLARRCAEVAYERGALLVETHFYDPHILRARIRAQTENSEALATVSSWWPAWQDAIVKEYWGYLLLKSHEDMNLMAQVDQNALMLHERCERDKIQLFYNAITNDAIPWCIAAVPGPRWAEHVLGRGKSAADLWRILVPILLLDRDNPALEWKKKSQILEERSRLLNNRRFDSLRFEDEGTRLVVGLLAKSKWMGGETIGRGNLSNIPTEEIYTTPDRTRCDGFVRITRTIELRNIMLKDAEFTFKDGVLVGFDAKEGLDALKSFVEFYEGARRLGEVALVDESSPIAQSKLHFGSSLFDENASCHIALGAGYPSCIECEDKLDTEEKKIAAGCNVSLAHLDLMIGSPGMSVFGLDAEGRETPIIVRGRFVI